MSPQSMLSICRIGCIYQVKRQHLYTGINRTPNRAQLSRRDVDVFGQSRHEAGLICLLPLLSELDEPDKKTI
jgi:hypothetical protein